VNQIQVDLLADDPGVSCFRRANQIRSQFQDGVLIEFRSQPFLRQLDAISDDAREADFKRIAIRAHGSDLDGFAWRLRWSDDRFGGEVEGDAENVGVFDIEQALTRAVFIQIVRLAAQSASDNLFAKELRSEGAHAQNVRDGIGPNLQSAWRPTRHSEWLRRGGRNGRRCS